MALVELVTEPDFVCANQAAAFVTDLACVLSSLGVCGANASTGELRVDVNVSVGPSWTDQGPRTEVKNVNSIRSLARAIGMVSSVCLLLFLSIFCLSGHYTDLQKYGHSAVSLSIIVIHKSDYYLSDCEGEQCDGGRKKERVEFVARFGSSGLQLQFIVCQL